MVYHCAHILSLVSVPVVLPGQAPGRRGTRSTFIDRTCHTLVLVPGMIAPMAAVAHGLPGLLRSGVVMGRHGPRGVQGPLDRGLGP